MRKYLFILSCLLLLSGELFAQDRASVGFTDSDKASLNAQRPTVDKIVGSTVDYYTGTANIRVGLHTISSHGFTIPLALQYHASGIKADTRVDWVGDNWKLTGGGRITRIIKNQPDEVGWTAGHGAIASNDMSTYWTKEKIKQRLSDGFDSEPDFYQFELPTGQYGAFVMKPDKSIVLFPDQDIKITQVDTTMQWTGKPPVRDSYFIITDMNGMKYYFGKSENGKELSSYWLNNEGDQESFITGWMLERITDGTKEIARFAYDTIDERFNGGDNYYWWFEHDTAAGSISKVHELATNTPIYTVPRVLTSVSWPLGRLELITRQSTLDEIRVLGYDDSLQKTIHLGRTDDRRVITDIYETSQGQQRDICSFEYYDGPTDAGTYTDRWGFLNGEPFSQTNPNNPRHTYMGQQVDGFSREPNFYATRKRSLQKIVYPTGGWTEFEYELHQGRFPMNTPENMYLLGGTWSGELYTVGGLRIKSITQYKDANDPGSKIQYAYQHPTDVAKGGQIFSGYLDTRVRKKSGKVTTYGVALKPDYQFLDYTGSPVLYNYVREILPNGSYNEYEFTGLSDYMDLKGEMALGTDFSLNIYMPDHHHMVPFSSQYFRRGLLKQVTQYDASGQNVHTETYTYHTGPEKDAVNAYLLFAVNPESDAAEYYKGRYKWSSCPVVLASKTTSGLYEPSITTTYSYLSDYADLLPRSIEETSGETSIKTILKYPQDYYPLGIGVTPDTLATESEAEAHAIAWLSNKTIRSTPIETIHFSKSAGTSSYNVIGGTIDLYAWSPQAKRWLQRETKSLLVDGLSPNITVSQVNTDANTGKKTLVRDARYDTRNPQTIQFNEKGFPSFITFSGPAGKGTRILYEYDNQIPVARVTGVSPSATCAYVGFEDKSADIAAFLGNKAKSGHYVLPKNTAYAIPSNGGSTVSYWRWNGSPDTKWEEVKITPATDSYTILEPNHYVDEVRVTPPDASMTTQAIKPGIGILSEVDEKGAGRRYDYNALGMLESIARHDGQTVEKYAYTYGKGSALYYLSASLDAGSSGLGQVSIIPTQVNAGGSATFTAIPNPGYQLTQWQFSDGTTSTEPVAVKNNIQSDLSAVASFHKVYTLTVSVESGSFGRGNASVSPGMVVPGGSATFTAIPNPGYQFAKWEFSDKTVSTDSSTVKSNIQSDLTAVASFNSTLDLSVETSGGGTASVDPKKIFPGGSATFTATASSGNKFMYWWFLDNGVVKESESTDPIVVKTDIQHNLVGRAFFGKIIEVIAQVDSGSSGWGQVSINPSQVFSGETVTFTATPNPGYRFSKWQFNDGTTSDNAVTVKENVRPGLVGTASFAPLSYTMSATRNSPDWGQATVSPYEVTTGGSATWSATAALGYVFDHWEFSDGTTATNPITTKTNISQNITGTAIFKKRPEQVVNFFGTIMPRDGYWAVHITADPDVFAEGTVTVYTTGYFFINPDTPERIDAQFSGAVSQDGYILSNATFNENDNVGELNGTISLSDPNYIVGNVSWY